MDDTDAQDATERFRARVAARSIPLTPPARRSTAPWIVAALLLGLMPLRPSPLLEVGRTMQAAEAR